MFTFDREGAPLGTHLDNDLRWNHGITSAWMCVAQPNSNSSTRSGTWLWAVGTLETQVNIILVDAAVPSAHPS